MRRLLCIGAALALLAACSSDAPSSTAPAGFSVVVQYDSSMQVEAFAVAGVGPDGAEVWPRTELDAPLFLDPPGVRQARLSFETPAVTELRVLVDGLDGPGGAVIGSGHARAVLDPEVTEILVQLGVPVACGDGRLSGREACDDGNSDAGDGCSPLCIIEPGYTCEGLPSRCGRCGDGELGPGERCDDGNLVDGDGCSSACQPEEAQDPYLYEVEALAPIQIEAEEGAQWTQVPGTQLEVPETDESEHWIIFASGAFGSSTEGELAAQVGLLIDGELVDDFGHQTMGAADNEAGFVTFHVLTGGQAHAVELVATAAEGTTTLRDVRVVAMRLPSWARFEAAQARAPIEIRGTDQPLLELELQGDVAGRYLVLAKGNFTESPGADTARLWLSTPQGPVPMDDLGVTFSSPRDAKVPFFVARAMQLGPDGARFELRGTSSGAGSVEGWWDRTFPYRRRVTVTAGQVALPEGLAVPVRFDHEAMVEAGAARADGRDLRVVVGQGGNATEVTRAIDPVQGWRRSDTTVWVRLPAAVAPGDTLSNLWLYFGASPEEDPPADPSDVFAFFDTFEARSLGAAWDASEGNVQLTGGELRLDPGASAVATVGANSPGVGHIFEAYLAFDQTPSMGQAALLSTGGVRADALTGAGFVAREGQVFAASMGMSEAVMPDPLTTPQRYGILHPDMTAAVFSIDGAQVANLPAGLTGNQGYRLGLANTTDAAIVYQWVRVRRAVAEPPTVSVEPITGAAGLRPSRFDGLRVLALRVDGFEGFFSAVNDERVRTTESATTTLTVLEVPEAQRPREHLVLMSTRVAGDSDGERARSGLCLADGQALLQTRHRINRDTTDPTGYHHVAGVVDARTTADPVRYETAIRSPDGLGVEGAASSAAVIRF